MFSGPIRSSRDPHPVEDPDAVTFTGRLVQAGRGQPLEHLVTAAALSKPKALKFVDNMSHRC